MEHVQNFIQLSSVKVTPQVEEDFDVADQLLIIYSAFAKYSKRNDNKMGLYFSHSQTKRTPIIQLAGRFHITFLINSFFYRGEKAPRGPRLPHCRGIMIPLKTHNSL
jgi:hypothetical protein